MSFADVAEAIREKFRDDVATPNSLTVLNDNEPPKPLAQSWYRLSIEPENGDQVYTGWTGARRFRISGRAMLSLFKPVAKGDGEMLDIVDAVITAFRAQSIASPIILFRPAPTLVGPLTVASGWFERTMEIPFEADVFS